MKKGRKFIKDQGITLVALIITIIVLIILAVVSINAVLNSNFINIAIQGTINYAEAQTNEQEKMERLDYHLQGVIEKIEGNDLSETGSNPINPTYTPVITPDYHIIIDPINDIGKYVNYIPINGSYTALRTYSGFSSDQTFNTEADMKWRIFKLDNNRLYLISDRTTRIGGLSNGNLYLYGCDGYNNGVKLLNDICSECYSNSEYSGMKARSLNIGDIENIITFDYKGYKNYGTTMTVRKGGSSHPNIWSAYEKYNQLENRNSQAEWYKGLGATEFDEEHTSTLMHNYWTATFIVSDYTNPNYYDLLSSFGNQANVSWLASRGLDFDSSR